MTWIKTIPFTQADAKLRAALDGQQALYPREYKRDPADDGAAGIVATHTLIPEALHHAFATFGVLLSPDLPLARRQHELITTVVSATNNCNY